MWIRRRLFLVFFSILVLTGSVQGQLVEVADPADFSEDAVGLDFSFFPPQEIPDAGHSLAAWGVDFSGNLGSATRIEGVVTSSIPVPVVLPVLKNMGGSSGSELILDLARSATRIGLWLGGDPSTSATLSAFGPEGESLGSLDKNGLSVSGAFVGVQAPAGKRIAKLVIRYSNAPEVEQVHRLLIEYGDRRPFEVVLAQIADGPVGSQAFKTTIVISNLSNTTSAGELRLFGDSADTTPPPLVLTLDGPAGPATDSVFPFSLPPFTSITYATRGVGPGISVGYATISAEAPVGGTALFTTLNGDGSIAREAGVGSGTGLLVSTGAVLKAGSLDSGVAAVNTGDSPVDATVELFDLFGNLVATNDEILDLAAGGHVARFLPEMFPGAGDQFQGSIVVTADRPMALAVLRSVGGFVASSLPVGSTER